MNTNHCWIPKLSQWSAAQSSVADATPDEESSISILLSWDEYTGLRTFMNWDQNWNVCCYLWAPEIYAVLQRLQSLLSPDFFWKNGCSKKLRRTKFDLSGGAFFFSQKPPTLLWSKGPEVCVYTRNSVLQCAWVSYTFYHKTVSSSIFDAVFWHKLSVHVCELELKHKLVAYKIKKGEVNLTVIFTPLFHTRA